MPIKQLEDRPIIKAKRVESGFVRLGGGRHRITKSICEKDLGGKWIDPYGCIVNSKLEYRKVDNNVYVTPIGQKLFPVIVNRQNFRDMTGTEGMLSGLHTFMLRK